MPDTSDILIAGTGHYAEIIIFDLAITAEKPLRVAIGGRNRERMDWLALAGNARAAVFARPVTFTAAPIEWETPATIARTIAELDPAVVLHAATMQLPWLVDNRAVSEWAHLVESAGYGITGAFQALLSARTAEAMVVAGNTGAFVNSCYPDVVNQIVKAKKLPMTSGVGNVEAFAVAIAADMGIRERGRIKILAHHQHLPQWRLPGPQRSGEPIRVWIDGEELDGVQERFAHIQLPFRELNVITGCAAVPVLLALVGHMDYVGHVPGPFGLPGGYPVAIRGGNLEFDLPPGLVLEEATAWLRHFEVPNGMSITEDGRAVYPPKARREIAAHSPKLAEGFHVDDLEQAYADMMELREKLGG